MNLQLFLKLGFPLGILGCFAVLARPATAGRLPNSPSANHPEPSLVPVHQLAPTKPTDWAFQKLEQIAAEQGCELKAPEPTLPRSVFAAQLQACLSQMPSPIDEELLGVIQQLRSQYEDELIPLTDQLSTLERRSKILEQQQFSPTTQMSGEVIFALGAAAGGQRADDEDDPIDGNLFFGSQVELSFETSFTGEDELVITFQARNVPELESATGTPMANLGFDGDEGFDIVELDEIEYELPLSDDLVATLSFIGGSIGGYVPNINSLFGSGETGSVSSFGEDNPIVQQGSGVGLGLSYDLGDWGNLSIGYAAGDAEDPTTGLTGGPYGAIAQFTVRPTNTFSAALVYVRSFDNVDTGAGSLLADEPFGDESEATIANSYGAEISWDLSQNLTFGGRVGWIDATATDLTDSPRAQLFTWAMMLGVTDLTTEGDLLGFIVGQPVKVTYNALGSDFEDPDASLHLEVFYGFPLTENFSLTPGVFVITNPNHDRSNDTIAVGTVRLAVEF